MNVKENMTPITGISETDIKKKVKEIITKEFLKNETTQYGVSYEGIRNNISLAIKEISKNPSPYFIKLFGNRVPSLEEFIFKVLVTAEEQEQEHNAK